jgi:hypothetical protein
MRSRVLDQWLERLTANALVATVLGSIPASSDTVESEGRQMKQCLISYIKRKIQTNPPLIFRNSKGGLKIQIVQFAQDPDPEPELVKYFCAVFNYLFSFEDGPTVNMLSLETNHRARIDSSFSSDLLLEVYNRTGSGYFIDENL